jgi:hypothetical protein
MLKKLSFTLMAITLALATLGAAVVTAFAKSPENNETGQTVNVATGQSVTTRSGRDGIYIASSPYSGELDLSHTKQATGNHLRGTNAKFVDNILTMTVDNTKERQATPRNANGYVYFDLTKGEQQMWQGKLLAIYGYNSTTQTWTALPTRWVSAGTTGYGRLVAPLSSYTDFGLATPKS